MSSDFAPSDPSIDRRTLLKAAAWTTPILLLATPAPAAAASGGATGQLSFTNETYYWSYGDGGVIGLAANTTVGFDEGGTGTLTTIALVIRIENADGQYLVGGAPTILLGAPAWTAPGPGVEIDVAGVKWIEYTFVWAGTLVSIGFTDLLEALVPLTVPLPSPPAGSPWSMIASAPGNPGVLPAPASGTGSEFEDRKPPAP